MTAPLSVIIVEDQALLALELQALVEEAGHVVAACVASLEEARKLEGIQADVAFVDIHLEDGPTGVDVATVLHERDVMVIFMTANVKRIPIDFTTAVGVIAKPYTMGGVLAALDYLVQGVRAPPPRVGLPPGLTLSPRYLELWTPSGGDLK